MTKVKKTVKKKKKGVAVGKRTTLLPDVDYEMRMFMNSKRKKEAIKVETKKIIREEVKSEEPFEVQLLNSLVELNLPVFRQLLIDRTPENTCRFVHLRLSPLGDTIIHALCQDSALLPFLKHVIEESKIPINLNAKNHFGQTIFHKAVLCNSVATVRYLLETRETINLRLLVKD